ncbi:MAG: glycosyltransferase [Lentimicrobium sp.]
MNGKNKILIASGTFFPENSPRSFRTTELAKELGRVGHDVTILIPRNYKIDYTDFEKKYQVRIKFYDQLSLPEISGSFEGRFGIIKLAIRRLLLMLFEYPSIKFMYLVKKALITENDYDLLISIAVPFPIHWGVAWARTRKKRIAKVWVADCGDPYMGCKTDSFKKLFYFKYLEQWFCRKADYISIPNKDHINQYYSEFHGKIKFIPQGFRFEDSNIHLGEIENAIPTFAFAGVLLKTKRDPAVLLEYLASVDVDFKFILYTESNHLIEPFKKKLGNKIEVRPYIRREALLYELSKMDFLLNIEFHSSVKSNSPSKLIDYAIVDRPVLSLSMESLNTSLIDEFLGKNYKNRLQIIDINRFRIENVAKQFIDLVE